VNLDALFWIMIVGMTAACVAAIAVRSLHAFSRHDLEEIARARQKPERFADILRHHDRVGLGVEMVVAMLVAATVCAAMLWLWETLQMPSWPPWLMFLLAVLALGQIVAILTVWLPWSLARIAAAPFLFWTWSLWSALGRLAQPLVWSAQIVDFLLHRLAGQLPREPDEDAFEEEIRTIVSEGHREGLIEEEAREMIEGVIELGDVVVSHIMTPRTEIHMVQVNTPWEEVIERVIASGHTRVPVYDKSRDDIVGILYSKDLLPELAKPADVPRRPLRELLRKPSFVPETKPVDDLLKWFQKSRTHMAVVLDEYGGVSGIVTIEDVLEEIVGEIDDEYDEQSEVEIQKIDDHVCEALGRAHVHEINELMEFDLPHEQGFDTIGGFVFTEFGRVPAVGESITWQDSVRVTVLDASRRRVNRVRLERIPRESLEMAE